MKRLKSKTFYTILIILTSILVISLFIINYQVYRTEFDRIKDNLVRMVDISFMDNKFDRPKEDLNRRIIMDYDVYTIFLDSNNKIVDTISHNENEEVEIDVSNLVNDIVTSNKNDRLYIGNLYLSKYSYNYKQKNIITIVDNSGVKDKLVVLLIRSIIIFIIVELLILFVSKIITAWIVRPAIESFRKQKEFIADASHELKTPLAIIMSSSELIDNDIGNNKWLNNIKSETKRMNNLVNNLLNLSMLEDYSSNYNKKLEDLSKIVEKQCLTFEGLVFDNNLKLNYEIEDNIKFNCNKTDINELMSILLDNAIKHSYAKKEIKVNLYRNKSEVILEVINEGKEIASEDRDRIFERFYKIDKSRNRNSNNYGLGLAIAKAIVERHNGKISVECRDGFTIFRVLFK